MKMDNMRRIRVLHLITDLGKGGAERYALDLCRDLLLSSDFECMIGVLMDNNHYKSLVKGLVIRNLNYKTFSLTRKNECFEYFKLLEEFRPHVIHTHRFLAEFLSSYYLPKDVVFVCHGHDNMEQFKNFGISTLFSKKNLLQFVEKQIVLWRKYRNVKPYFIANSRHTEQFFKNVLPTKMLKNVVLMHCGFNFKRFYNPIEKFVAKRKRIKILNVSSFHHPKKNQVFIISIAKELLSRGIDFEINLLGDGMLLPDVKSKVVEQGLQSTIFFHGNKDDVENWYKESDIYLHTAWYEPFGLVFLEAMASGLPVIALDGMGNRDIIMDGVNGFLIQKQDSTLFANAIERILKDDDLYASFSKSGKNYASKFDASVKSIEMMDFYRRILE